MKRVAAHHIFCSPEHILKLSVIEQDNNDIITRIFSLNDNTAEPAHTIFYDGVITIPPVSLSEANCITDKKINDFTLLNAEKIRSGEKILNNEKPLLIDFGTSDINKINEYLILLADRLIEFDVFEIINACTFRPANILGRTKTITEGIHSNLVNWKSTSRLTTI
jgi:hypothetical protein